MDNKIFKEMIKQHKVKQSFVRIRDDITLKRFYQDTTNNDKYLCVWCDNGEEIVKTVTKIGDGIWTYHWHKYVSETLDLRSKVKDNLITRKNNDNCPMYRKKFEKIIFDTLIFMLKDKRI